MVMNMLTKLNLKQALEWSKRESEQHPEMTLLDNDDPTTLFTGECKEEEK
jgi:hypothetical protein